MKPSEIIKSQKPPTMYDRVGEKTPDPKKDIKYNLKTIRDIRTSNTVTKNRGMIRDDVNINVSGIYQLIAEEQKPSTFPNSLARLHGKENLKQIKPKKVQKDLTTHLIPKDRPPKGRPNWNNIKGGR